MKIAPQKQKALIGEPNEWLQRTNLAMQAQLGKG
jgi:hypothetical protein